MTIADKMQQNKSSIPVDIQLSLLQRRLADTIRYFQEVRALYKEATGISFVPSELLPDDVTAVTDQDVAWLAQLGISL